MEKKRRGARKTHDVEGKEESPRKMRAYEIVKDSKDWVVIDCTMNGGGGARGRQCSAA